MNLRTPNQHVIDQKAILVRLELWGREVQEIDKNSYGFLAKSIVDS